MMEKTIWEDMGDGQSLDKTRITGNGIANNRSLSSLQVDVKFLANNSPSPYFVSIISAPGSFFPSAGVFHEQEMYTDGDSRFPQTWIL